MKRNLQAGIFSALVASIVLSSCSRENSVVSNHGIQKRKYNSGYHINFKGIKKSQGDKAVVEENVLAKVEEVNSNYDIIIENKNQEVTKPALDMTIAEQETPQVANNTKETKKEKKNNLASKENKSEVSFSFNKVKRKDLKKSVHAIQNLSKKEATIASSGAIEPIVYIILCILIPVIAVGLATDWDLAKTLIALLLMFLFWLPGIIFAFIICSQEGVI